MAEDGRLARALDTPCAARLENNFLRWQRFERADLDLTVGLRRRARLLTRRYSPVTLKGPAN
jgi:hypothetical protein